MTAASGIVSNAWTKNGAGRLRLRAALSSGGSQAIFITNSGGAFDISRLTSGGTTAGSIAGAASYFLGANALTVGSSRQSQGR